MAVAAAVGDFVTSIVWDSFNSHVVSVETFAEPGIGR